MSELLEMLAISRTTQIIPCFELCRWTTCDGGITLGLYWSRGGMITRRLVLSGCGPAQAYAGKLRCRGCGALLPQLLPPGQFPASSRILRYMFRWLMEDFNRRTPLFIVGCLGSGLYPRTRGLQQAKTPSLELGRIQSRTGSTYLAYLLTPYCIIGQQ